MSEHQTGGSGGRPESGPKTAASDDTPEDKEVRPQTRGPGWGQGSRFGANAHPDPIPPPAPEPPSAETSEPKRRRKKEAPTHPRHTVPVVSGKVTIHRDKQGTAHIQAKQEHDAWAALGFCCAEDRLWQMDVLRRVACGRAAEVFGSDWLMHDSLVRTAGVARRAGAAAQRMQGLAHEMLTAYAGGVNAARALGQPPEATAVGYEVAPWTVADSLALELYWAWSLACRVWPSKLLAAEAAAASQPDSDPRTALWGRLDMRVAGWAEELRVPDLLGAVGFVTPTANAAQLGAQISGPPGALAQPYAAHLRSPGLDIAGFTIPGVPIFIAGRNKTIAWSGSALITDDVDLVMEELDGIGNFRSADGRQKAARRQELVRVRDAEDRRIEVVETRHGPLLSGLAAQFWGAPEDSRISIAVRWGLNSLGTSQAGWLALARAGTVTEAKAAAKLVGLGPVALELLVADADGQEARLRAGRIPVRAPATQWPVRGWHAESRWNGARVLSEESEAAKSDPSILSLLLDQEAPAQKRLREILEGEHLDGPGAAMVLSDVADEQAAGLAEILGRHLDPETRGAQLLATWDSATVPDSAGAAFFWVLVLKFMAKQLYDDVEYRILARRPIELMRRLGEGGDVARADPDRLREAAQQAEAFLTARCGSDWRWAHVCHVDRAHLLATAELFAVGGLPDRTLMGSPGAIFGVGLADTEEGLRVITEPCARLICDLSTSHAAMVVSGGTSGSSTSIHFADQAATFNEGRLTSFPVDAEVEGDLSELLP